MRRIRLACPAGALPGAAIFLSPDQARHGALVLRLALGDEIELVGPEGLALARVSLVEKNPPRLGVTLTGPWVRPAASGPGLALALIQSQRFDWAVEKAVELGASALLPLISERVKSGEARPGAGKEERWKRLAEEARKQCGRASALELYPVLSLNEVAAQARPGSGLFLSPTGPVGPPPETEGPPLIVVGPEGGLTPAEEEALRQAGFRPWSLGLTILRAETAALAALAILMGRPA